MSDDSTVSYRRKGTEKIAHFLLMEHIGTGRFGDVWRAHDTTLDRFVAIKIPRTADLDSEETELFFREARAAAQLSHPNIVSVHEVGYDNNTIYIVSDLVQGANLREWLSAHELIAREAADLCRKIADALHHAHDAGVIHRDLKPSNIMLDAEGEPHIMDFGLAKREGAEITMTVEGRILGTPAYMSPEQARGEGHSADCRSDVYSLGVILYELLTGKRPFRGESRILIYQVLNEEPSQPRKIRKDIPRDLETICLKAMAKSPDRRYQTSEDFARDLGRFLNGQAIHARRVTIFERGYRWIRRNPLTAAAIITALLTSGVALAFGILVLNTPTVPPGAPAVQKPLTVHLLTVHLKTKPPGATIVFYPRDRLTGEPIPEKAVRPDHLSPVTVDLLPGDYLVVAALDNQHFHEVYRRVPSSPSASSDIYWHRRWEEKPEGTVELHEITIPDHSKMTASMAYFEGGSEFQFGAAGIGIISRHRRKINAFFLDFHEVTIEEFGEIHKIQSQLVLKSPESSLDFPITGLFYDNAVEWAERAGKRLPTEFEYEFAATDQGQQKYPWGENGPEKLDWTVQPVGLPEYDKLRSNPRVTGLFSNASEWTASWFLPYPQPNQPDLSEETIPASEITVRGGPSLSLIGNPDATPSARWIEYGARFRLGIRRKSRSLGLGFRCARSARPRLNPEDF